MAVLEKIRVKFGLVISIIIALALLSFIIDPSTLESALSSMSSKNDVGVIAGKSVSFTEYSENIEKYNTLYEIMTGSSVQDEAAQRSIRDEAWNELVNKYMFIKNAEAAGVVVGTKEMDDLTVGENGINDFESLSAYIRQLPVNLGNMYWNYIYNSIRTSQFHNKYLQLFVGASAQNDLQKQRLMAQNNTTANVDYVFVPFPVATDSTVVVSDSEIRQYYKDHKKSYARKANRDIEYVVFEVEPSAEDIAAANEKFVSGYDRFSTTDNLKSFLRDNSSRQFDNHWYKAGELNSVNREICSFVDANNSGVSPIVTDGGSNTFYAARIVDVKPIPDSIYVKHILLSASDRVKADSLAKVASKGGDFSALAAQYSLDQQSAADGAAGNIGWMTQTAMIPGFEGLFNAPVNIPQVISSSAGLHVAVVSRRTAPVVKKQVAIYEMTAVASSKTYNKVFSEANSFAALAGHTKEGYLKAVEETGQASHKLNVTEATSNYGAISQSKEVTRWVFDAKEGKVSDRITVNANYFFIVMVDKVRKEGFEEVSEVAPAIRNILYAEKLAQARKAAVAEDIKGLATLEEVAAKFGTSVENNASMSLGTMTYRGDDPALAGAVLAARDKVGQISAPVAGASGIYVFKVNSTEQGSFFTEDDAKMQAQRFASFEARAYTNVMADGGVVKDNRERFF